MPYDSKRHHRRSIRLRSYDYAGPGAYFVTLVTQERALLFGEVRDGEVILNRAGQMVTRWWRELDRKFAPARTDGYVVMPNHFHGVTVLIEPSIGASRDTDGSASADRGAHTGAPLHRIVQWFKTMTTNDYIRGVSQYGWPALQGKLWQRNYYEHVVRGEAELERIRGYIQHNPLKWGEVPENPENLADRSAPHAIQHGP